MPDTACLHIQAGETDPVRVVTLPGVSIRIGRAAYCEVRLPDVAEEECLLKRRGRTWHLVPVGRPGAVRIDEEPVEQSRPLPFGVPFRIGGHRLTLQSIADASTSASGGWGTFERPIAADVRANDFGPATPRAGGPTGWQGPVAPPAPDASSTAGPGPEGDEDRLARWKARQEQRASWRRAHEEEKRWEGRWKAAGDRLRSSTAAVPVVPSSAPADPGPPRRPEPPPYVPSSPTARVVEPRSLPRSFEPSPPSPMALRETTPALTPGPSIPSPVVPAPATRSDRASLAPREWGRTPVPPRSAPRIAPAAPSRGQIAPTTALPADLPIRKPVRTTAMRDELPPAFVAAAYEPFAAEEGRESFHFAVGERTATQAPFDPTTIPEGGSSFYLGTASSEFDPGFASIVRGPGEDFAATRPSALLGAEPQSPSFRWEEESGVFVAFPDEAMESLSSIMPFGSPPGEVLSPSLLPGEGEPDRDDTGTDEEERAVDRTGEERPATQSEPTRDEEANEQARPPAVEPGTRSGTEIEVPAGPAIREEVRPEAGTFASGVIEEPGPSPDGPTFATWVEAPLCFEPGALLGEGPFVADTNLGRTEGWAEPEPEPVEGPSARPERDQGPAEVAPRTRPSPGRRRRTTTRQGAFQGRAAPEPGPVADDPSTRRAPAPPPPPIEGPAPGPTARDPLQRLPTAREILAAQRVRPQEEPVECPGPTGRRAENEPIPTIGQEPAAWKVPLWLGWFPAVALTLAVGGAGMALSWSWAIEGEHAGHIADRLARGGSKPEPLPEWVTPPEPKWWQTTPGHLWLWALERDRTATATANDPAAVEEVHELLSAALQVSPLEARARFAMARDGPVAGAAVDPASSLALSRDVVTMGWTAHRLMAAGKKEEALRAYRSALGLASKADPARLAAPAFIDDAQIRRYALPGEDLIGPLVRDMAEHEGWTYAEWSEALPAFAVAPLAAARVLRERSSPDASAPLDAILAAADAPAPDGVSAAVHLAAQAEAFALKARWDEAERRYRRAIELMPELSIRRSWWMNLAEIALRLNDESSRQKALEAARGTDLDDEITRRAAEILKSYHVRGESINTRDITASRLQ